MPPVTPRPMSSGSLRQPTRQVLERTKEASGNILAVAQRILENHQAELERVDHGSPRWLPSDPDRLPVYRELLDLEAGVLRRILQRDDRRADSDTGVR